MKLKKKIEAETHELNKNIQNQFVQIKQDILQRLDVIKAQFSTSQEGLSELKKCFESRN